MKFLKKGSKVSVEEVKTSSGLDSMEEVWTHLNSTYNDLDDIQDMFH